MKRRSFLLSAAALAATPALAGAQVTGGHAFGGTWRMVLPFDADVSFVQAQVDAVIAAVDAEMSPFRHDSLISSFNRRGTGEFPASKAVCNVAAGALEIAHLTGGAFDPTVGPIVSRLGFGPIRGVHAGFAGINVGDGVLIKTGQDATLDLCGIAKGFALDRIGATLAASGVQNALVELGGEVLSLGVHPDGRDWQIGIENPVKAEVELQRIISPSGMALATSGTKVNSYKIGDRLVSHLIDPRNGTSVANVASVSVLADTAMRADALATGLAVMGDQNGGALADRLGIPAMFILADGRELYFGGFDRFILA